MASQETVTKALAERLERLTRRERGLLLAAILVVLTLVWNALAFSPLWSRRLAAESAAAQVSARVSDLTVRGAEIAARAQQDPDRDNRQRLVQLQEEIRLLDARLQEETGSLVSPREMPLLLEELLRKTQGLKLVGLENLPPVPILAHPAEGSTGAALTLPNLYRHGLRLELEGGFPATLAYLKALEQLPRGLFWDGLEFEVLEHPRARIVLTVYTLSLRQELIGV
jgi:MSHA biogenesis protein MshJ